MSAFEPVSYRSSVTTIDADRALKFGMGVAAAPLWATFFTAASAGVAYWWLTAWTRQEQSRSFAFADFEPAPEALIPVIEPVPAAPEPPIAQVYVESTVEMLPSEPAFAPDPAAAVEEVVEEVIEIVVVAPAAVAPEPEVVASKAAAAEAPSEPEPSATAASVRAETPAPRKPARQKPGQKKPH